MNTETAQTLLQAKAKALREEADAIDLAISILTDKYSGELVSLPALVQDNADKVVAIATLTSEKATLESEKAAIADEKATLESILAAKEKEITNLKTPLKI